MDVLLRVALEAIVKQFRLDGFDAWLGENCAYTGIGQAAVVAQIARLQPTGQGYGAGIWVGMRFDENSRPLFSDYVNGFGNNQDEAITSAMTAWLQGVLPPILPLLGCPVPAGVEVFGRGSVIDIPPWTVYAGPYQILGPQREALARRLTASHPWLQLRDILRGIEPGWVHWLRLFRCQGDGSDQADCFLDSELHEVGIRLLRGWDWPPVVGYHMFQQFLVLYPGAPPNPPQQQNRSLEPEIISPTPSRSRNSGPSLEDWVQQTINLFRTQRDANDPEIIDALLAAGGDKELAIKLVQFVPLAFYRVKVRSSGLRFVDHYLLVNAAGRTLDKKKLDDEPVFTAAVAAAEGEMAQRRGGDPFMAVVERSFEYRAVRQALKDGTLIEHLKIPPPRLLLES